MRHCFTAMAAAICLVSAQALALSPTEALARAQELQQSGHTARAIDVLHQSLKATLAGLTDTSGPDTMQIAMVKEWVRLNMGTGHMAEAHAWLVHNESRLQSSAELWALRANLAQRLGQHQDCVLAYMQALQASPSEPHWQQRWLLGMAVSLAAMGQTRAAGGVAQRASDDADIPQEVAEFLRQMGVSGLN